MSATPINSTLPYTSYAALPHAIDTKTNSAESLRQAAQQFESMFIDLWLQAARKTNATIAGDSPFTSKELETHQQMLDHEMSVHLAQQGGIGLADVIVAQLGGAPQTSSGAQQDTSPDGGIAHGLAEQGGRAAVGFNVAEEHRIPPSTPVPTRPKTAMGEITVKQMGSKQHAFSSPQEFVAKLRPVFESLLGDSGLPPLGVLSQAALETGWGREVIADPLGNSSHNLFGMKANDENQPSVRVLSSEFIGNRWLTQQSDFRSYPDWQSSVRDYVDKLKNLSRYADVMKSGGSVEKFANALAEGGYATDPAYAEKIVAVYRRVRAMVNL